MILTHEGGRYRLWDSAYAERAVPKAAGFRWDATAREWWTDDPDRAARLARYADPGCHAELAARREAQEAAVAASRAVDAAVEIPAPAGREYLPFQRAGIALAAGRPATLLADEMGLGKTIQALGVINLDPDCRRVLVVCPATLKLNWAREAARWLVRRHRVLVAGAQDWPPVTAAWPPEDTVVIVNYDVLHRHATALRAIPWDCLIVDEAHFVKNPEARRSEQLYGTSDRKRKRLTREGRPGNVVAPIPARRRLYLTGTPIVNRPIELWPLLHSLDPTTWRSFWSYAKRYAGAYQGAFGWDFRGADHLDELQERLRRTLMVRRLKVDVLRELPPKRRQVIEVAPNGTAGRVVAAEQAASARIEARLEGLRAQAEIAKADDDPGAYERAVAALREGERVAFVELSRLRHETARAKVPFVIEHLEAALGEGEHKVVCFAHHHDVVAAFAEAFGTRAVVLTGETPQAARQGAVDRFQTDPACVLFVGSLTAAGVGLTLTAASHVVFAELDWVPGNLTQAEDRCHRIGQAESVLVQHLVLDGSLDARMAQVLVDKQRVLEAALDRGPEPTPLGLVAVGLVADRPATEDVRRETLARLAAGLTAEQITAIHTGLRALAGVCDGAVTLDGAGFNKLDTRLGRELAARAALTPKQAALGQRLIRKYRRQLPGALLAVALGVKDGGEEEAQP